MTKVKEKKTTIQNDSKEKISKIIKLNIELAKNHSQNNKIATMFVDQSIKTSPIVSKIEIKSSTTKSHEGFYNLTGINSSINNWGYAKLENPNMNICFLNSAVQFIISIKPIADLLCYEYAKKYCNRNTFLSDLERIEILENPNQPISPETLAKKSFLIEFETLVTQMIRNTKKYYSASKLAKIYEVLEPGYTFYDQWDCSSVVDLIFKLYENFLCNEEFDGKSKAQEIINSLKIITIISTQCKKCNIIKEMEFKEIFLYVPLKRNISNIFAPFYSEAKDYCCDICNDLVENTQTRLVTGALQKTEIKSYSKYVLVRFGRVDFNFEKVKFKVTLLENNEVLGHHLKLETWVKHVGESIKSGHYVVIRREKQGCIRMSDDYFSSYNKKYIKNCNSCYIALLNQYKVISIKNVV